MNIDRRIVGRFVSAENLRDEFVLDAEHRSEARYSSPSRNT
jgi:hypothetical protein